MLVDLVIWDLHGCVVQVICMWPIPEINPTYTSLQIIMTQIRLGCIVF